MSRCRAAGAGGTGAPSTKAWCGRGGLPTWAGLGPGWTLPTRAGTELPAARGGGGEGVFRSRHSGLSAGPSALQGRRVSGVRTRLTQLGLRLTGPGLVSKSEREKVSNGTDVRPLTPTRQSETEREGLAVWWSSQARGVWSPRRAARRCDRRLRIPDSRRYPLTWTRAPAHSQTAPLPRSWSAFQSSRAPHLRLQKDQLQVFTPRLKCA